MTELRGRWPIWDTRSAIRPSAMSCNAMLCLPPRSASARQPGRLSFGSIWRCWPGPTSSPRRCCRVGPGNFTPSLSQIPDVNLSIHPARVTARRLPPSAEPSGSSRYDPVGPSSTAMTCPLHSTGITPLRRYYEAVRPSPAHRYFRPRGWSRLCLFPWHRRPGSHVPYKSQIELRAAYMPDAAWAVSGHPPSRSRRQGQPPVLTSPNPLSTLPQRFACARLSQSYLSKSCSDFSATFTTVAFDHSSLRWLEINT